MQEKERMQQLLRHFDSFRTQIHNVRLDQTTTKRILESMLQSEIHHFQEVIRVIISKLERNYHHSKEAYAVELAQQKHRLEQEHIQAILKLKNDYSMDLAEQLRRQEQVIEEKMIQRLQKENQKYEQVFYQCCKTLLYHHNISIGCESAKRKRLQN
jgi:hypothetical protein